MKLEFGKYADITAFAKRVNPSMFEMYTKVYICPDTQNWWLAVIQEGVDSDFEPAPGKFLIERDQIDYPYSAKCDDRFLNAHIVGLVVEDWDGSSWDNYEADSLEEAIELVDGGYGIIAEEAV